MAVAVSSLLFLTVVIASTYRDNRLVVRQIQAERDFDKSEDGRPGRILLSTAAVMNVAPWDAADAGPVFFGEPGDPEALRIAEGVQRRAEKQARLSWVVLHPYGVAWPTRRVAFVWLIVRFRYLIGKPI